MKEEPFYFPSGGYRLFGIMNAPDGAPKGGILFCHGFTGHHIEPQRLFVDAARRLQRAGFVVLRFDYRGSGDSEGDFEEGTPAAYVDDAETALRMLGRAEGVDGGSIGMLGFSLGGAVAACVAGRVPEIASVALWAAVASPRGVSTPQGERLADGRFDMGGVCVTAGFLAEFHAMDPVAELARSGVGSVFIAHGMQDASVPLEQAGQWEAGLRRPGRRIERVDYPGVGHAFERVETRRDLFERTASWFLAGLPCRGPKRKGGGREANRGL